jgi:hypothetical protein
MFNKIKNWCESWKNSQLILVILLSGVSILTILFVSSRLDEARDVIKQYEILMNNR